MVYQPMRITAVRYHVQMVPFRFAFRHAGARRTMNETLFIAVETDRGHTGYGECIPRSYLTGETIESCLKTLQEVLVPQLVELRFTAESRPDEPLRSLYESSDSARALAAYGALDIAVFDAWARHFSIPMTRMFGAGAMPDPKLWDLTAPIGLGMPIWATSTFFRRQGFRRFKIKIQSPSDVTRIARMREVLGPGVPILVDANGSLETATAAADLTAFGPFGVVLCEEPIAARSFRELVELEQTSGMPLMADESLCTLADADAITTAGGIRWWNLRLAKNGGFTGVMTLAQKARQGGVQVQLGALVGETSLLNAASATILPILRPTFAESSFPRWLLRHDPFTHGPRTGAALRPNDGVIGLGVLPTRSQLSWRTMTI
jgi:muconate cycloisomerase